MKVLEGKSPAAHETACLKPEVEKIKKHFGFPPGLAVILVGEDPASQIYVGRKIKACAEAGLQSWKKEFPSSVTLSELKSQIQEFNENPQVHGILVQLPLPPSLNSEEVLSYINPHKDPDGLTLENRALFWAGTPRVVPCTPFGIMKMLKFYDIPIEGRNAVVVGRSQIVGLPAAGQLLSHNATVTLCHSRTKNLMEHTSQADIVIACAGKRGLLGREDFKKGAVVVDVGIHRGDQGLEGDVKKEGLEDWLSGLTPVPGGVGPMTIAMLVANTVHLAGLSLTKSQ
ncbi:MAG: bifunctional 5,10-methylenetetrahydrofolate dehydrogenase/5,10-methenyltetrahydrofolate cyclohydrolase [Bdellovibrionales bacterium]|nr:bifunctional 5,10-methylenetetrahydrofolate dehydrogenase/5,10-methenyltetrahydrofolate cyclohydrolase [Bdellovibrionales bacterium]